MPSDSGKTANFVKTPNPLFDAMVVGRSGLIELTFGTTQVYL